MYIISIRCATWFFAACILVWVNYSQAAERGAANTSVDAAFAADSFRPGPYSRLGYKATFFITNRRIDFSEQDRARIPSARLIYENLFSNQPHVGVAYGSARISYPLNRQRGTLSYGRNSVEQNPLVDFSILEHQFFNSPDSFYQAIRREYPNMNAKALLFVHGFDTTFNNAASTVVQLVLDLDVEGVPLFFSWPSDHLHDETSLPLQYSRVKRLAEDSRPYAVLAMDALADGIGRRFEMIAHSMGTDIAANAVLLREAARTATSGPSIPHTIVLAAPDISTRTFDTKLRPGLVRSDRHIVVYCSEDWALWFSRRTNGSDDRLGYCGTRLTIKPLMKGVDLVAVRGRISEFFRHSYYLSEQRILDDMRSALADSASSFDFFYGTIFLREIIIP
jgi:esterase/lipase superfamily enzyme